MPCSPIVVKVTPLGGVFGQGTRLVEVQGVLIPPQLNQTIASQETGEDSDTEQIYFLLRRFCTSFSQDVLDSIIEPIRAKVASTQDLTLLTADERTQARTLNRLFNTDFDQLVSVGTVSPQFGLIQ